MKAQNKDISQHINGERQQRKRKHLHNYSIYSLKHGSLYYLALLFNKSCSKNKKQDKLYELIMNRNIHSNL